MFQIIIAFFLAFCSSVAFSSSDRFLPVMSNMTFFYIAIIIAFITMFLTANKSKIPPSDVCLAKNTPILIISSIFSVVLVLCGFFVLYDVLNTYYVLPDLVNPLLLISSGFSMLVLSVGINSGKMNSQALQSASTVPIYCVIIEIIVQFRENLVNPLLYEFVPVIFALMATTLAYYYFASIFCDPRKQSKFYIFLPISIFFTTCLALMFIFAYVNHLADNIVILKNINYLIWCLCLNGFLISFYFKLPKNKFILE